MSTTRATQRRHRSVLVLAGDRRASEGGALALATALEKAGIEILYLGREANAQRIAVSAVEARADAVEVCLAGAGGVTVLRALLRELRRLDRSDVSIVVHRVQ